MCKRAILLTIGLAAFLVAPAAADWFPGDPHKMHFPQLPDPEGWDVNVTTPKILADDWKCTETGPVDDVHFWGSWEGDQVGVIGGIRLSIHANVPGPPYSQPGALLWSGMFNPGQFKVRLAGTGPQGWYDPNTGRWKKPDHLRYYQINIVNIPNPFVQKLGTIYWLDISVLATGGKFGWKTSKNHFMDDAVWRDPGTPWQELRDPITRESLDLAFVITPEPGSLGLLGLGALLLVARRRI